MRLLRGRWIIPKVPNWNRLSGKNYTHTEETSETRWQKGPQFSGVAPTLATFEKLEEMQQFLAVMKEKKQDLGVIVTQVTPGNPSCVGLGITEGAGRHQAGEKTEEEK